MRRGCWLRRLSVLTILVLAPALSGCATLLWTAIGSSFDPVSPPPGLDSLASEQVGAALRVTLNDGRIVRARYRGIDSLATPGAWSLEVRLAGSGPLLPDRGHRDSALAVTDIREVRVLSSRRGRTIGFCAGLAIDATLITLAIRSGDRVELWR